MATTRTTVPARTTRARKPATEYPIREVLTANVRTGAVFAVPGLRFTLADIQACIDNREVAGIVRLYCETCGETVADCPELCDKLHRVPEEWGWEYQARLAEDDEAEEG